MSRSALVQTVFDVPGGRKLFHVVSGRRPTGADSLASLAIREQIPRLLEKLQLVGCGVEVGVQSGAFSETILDYWAGRRLISIDPWSEAPTQGYVDIANVDQAAHDALYHSTLRRLRRFGERSDVWRLTGSEAALLIESDSLDFAYLDARHDQLSVQRDIADWWPKIRSGGILAGHDYVDGDFPNGKFGVKSAVDAFARAAGLPVFVTNEPDWPSWLIQKPTRPGH
ncbi:MAG: class I SAM-dependent methyltransferase [Actinomycetes bacterium]